MAPDSRAELLSEAEALRRDGMYEEANAVFAELAEDPSLEGRAAGARVAEEALDQGDPWGALAALAVAAVDGGPPLTAAGHYHLARALELVGMHELAAAAYLAYGELEPSMIDEAHLAGGSALLASGNYTDALASFTIAQDEAGDDATRYLAALRRGNALLYLGRPADALEAYSQAYQFATNDEDRAQALAGQIGAHVDAGEPELAAETRYRLVRDLTSSSLAPAALTRLEESGHSVPAMDRAAVLAEAGEHEQAVALFNEVMAMEAPTAQQRLAIAESYSALGQHEAAIAETDTLLAGDASDALASRAAWLRAQSLHALGRYREAANAYAVVADQWPTFEDSEEALWQRAHILQDLDGPAAAGAALAELARRFPQGARAAEATFRAGFFMWLSGDTAAANQLIGANLNRDDAFERSRAHYWLGRMALERGDGAASGEHWAQALRVDPHGYYGLRAAQRLGAAVPIPPASGGSPPQALTAWLRTWWPGAVPGGVLDALEVVQASRSVARARAWLDLGERRAAVRTMNSAVRDAADDPVALAALALIARDMGLHGSSIAAARHLLRSAPATAQELAPRALMRLAYPDAFGDLVREQAAAAGVPADLLFALIHAESRFEPSASSGAGAAGLTQVMPVTGESIAGWLGDEDYSPAQLHGPRTAVRYGARFLSRQLDSFDGQIQPALAAYNGGPGNAWRWLQDAGGDMDVLAEVIDYSETRRYVRRVIEALGWYELLYPDDA